MDAREELQSFLSDVYKLIPTLHATTRRISGVKALLYMKRDKANQDLLHLKENLNAYIQQLETQVEAVCEEKEQYLKTLQDGIFAQGMCLSSASESAEQLLEYGREDQLSNGYEILMNDFASVISATPNVNIELGCCLKFIPNIDMTAKRSAIGYIRYMDIDPADLKVSCDVTKAIVGKLVEAKIFFAKTPSDAALQYLDVSVVDENVQPIRFSLAKTLKDVLSFNFTPQHSGQHKLCVCLYECHAVNSPYCIHVEEVETKKGNNSIKPKLGGQTVETYKMPSTCGKQETRQNKDTVIDPSPKCGVNTAQSMEKCIPLSAICGMEKAKTPSIETGKLSSKPSGRKCEKFQSIEMYKPPSPTCEQTAQEDTCTRKERTASSPRVPRITLRSKVIFSSTPQSSNKGDPIWQETNKTNVQSRMINFHLKPSKMQSKASSRTKKPVSSTETSECLVSNRFQMSDASTSKSSKISNLNESHKTATRAEVSQWTPKPHKDRAKNSLTKTSVDRGKGTIEVKCDNSVSHFQQGNTGNEKTGSEKCFDNNRKNHEQCKSTKSNAIVKDHQLGSEQTSFFVNSPEEWELVDTDELFKLNVQSISCYEERKRKAGRQDSGFYEKESSPVDQLLRSNQGTSSFSNHEVLDDDRQACLTMHKSSEATEGDQVIVNDNDEQKVVSKLAVVGDVVNEPDSNFPIKFSSPVKIETDLYDDAKGSAENCKQDKISSAMKCVPDGKSTVEDGHIHNMLDAPRDVAGEVVKTMHEVTDEDTTFQDRAVMLHDDSDKAISQDAIQISKGPGDITVEHVKWLQDVTEDDNAVLDCAIMLGSMPEVDMKNVEEKNSVRNGACNRDHQYCKSHVEPVSLSGNAEGKEHKMERMFEDCMEKAMIDDQGTHTHVSAAEKETNNVSELFCDENQVGPVESASGYELDNVTNHTGSHLQSSRLQCSQEGVNLEESTSLETKETSKILIHGGHKAVMNYVNGEWVSANDVDSKSSDDEVGSSSAKTEPSIHHDRQDEDLVKFANEFVDKLLKKIHQDLCDGTILINDNVSKDINCLDHKSDTLNLQEDEKSSQTCLTMHNSSAMKCVHDGNSTVEDGHMHTMLGVPCDVAVEDSKMMNDQVRAVMLGDADGDATSQDGIQILDTPSDITVEDGPVESTSGYELDNVTNQTGSHLQSSRLQCSLEGANLEESTSLETKETCVNGEWLSSNDVDFKLKTSDDEVGSSNTKTEPSIHHVRQDEDLVKFASEFVDELLKKTLQDLCNGTILISDNDETQTNLAEVNRSESSECNKVLSSDHMHMVLDVPDENAFKTLIEILSDVKIVQDHDVMLSNCIDKCSSEEAIPDEDKDGVVILSDSSVQAVTSQENIMPDAQGDISVEDGGKKLIEIPSEDNVEVQSECCDMNGLKKDKANNPRERERAFPKDDEGLAGNGGHFQIKDSCKVYQQSDNRVLFPASSFRTSVIKSGHTWKEGNADAEQRSKSPMNLISSKNICDVSPSKKSTVVNAFTGHQKSPRNIIHLHEAKTTSGLSPNNFGSFRSDATDRLKNMDRTIIQRSRSPCNEAKNSALALCRNSNPHQSSSGHRSSQQLFTIMPNHSGVMPLLLPPSGIMAYPQGMPHSSMPTYSPTMVPYPAAYVPMQMMGPMYSSAMYWPMPNHSPENVNNFNANNDS